MKIKKINDKSIITYKPKKEFAPRVINPKKINDKSYCSDYIKGEDNFCLNYTGSKKNICSCYEYCILYIPQKKSEVCLCENR